MSEVSITINKRAYTVSCDDGQEAHLHGLAASVDGRISELVAGMGQIGDQRLLVMASLLLADELDDLKSENARLKDAARPSDVMSAPEAAVVRGIETLADRIEAVAQQVEQATEALNAGSSAGGS
jgi:cell division protein ZapA